MKTTTLIKMLFCEYKNYFILSIFLFFIIDFAFIHFSGLTINKESSIIFWLGGNEKFPISLSVILLKLLNIAVIFMMLGRMIDKLTNDFMVYIFSRIDNYIKFIKQCFLIITIIGLLLLSLSHIMYFCLIGIPEQIELITTYLAIDCAGFIGIITIYLILHNVYLIEHSFLIVIGLYVLNTMLPIPIFIATSTLEFLKFKSQLGIPSFIVGILLQDSLLILCYIFFIKRRRINLC